MNSLKGHLLIATPDLLAPLFARSVILMIDHDEDGAMGVILNRPTEASVSDLAGKIFVIRVAAQLQQARHKFIKQRICGRFQEQMEIHRNSFLS